MHLSGGGQFMGHSFTSCQVPRGETSTDSEGSLKSNDHYITWAKTIPHNFFSVFTMDNAVLLIAKVLT